MMTNTIVNTVSVNHEKWSAAFCLHVCYRLPLVCFFRSSIYVHVAYVAGTTMYLLHAWCIANAIHVIVTIGRAASTTC